LKKKGLLFIQFLITGKIPVIGQNNQVRCC
jgi:hypothetical protein